MNCSDSVQDLLLYLEQAETNVSDAFENNVDSAGSKSGKSVPNNLPKIEEESSNSCSSDPDDIQMNLQLLLKLNEAIKADLSDLLANQNEDDFHLDQDDKSFIEVDSLSDLESHSSFTVSNVNVATQTSRSPSASSTNLSWASSGTPGSDTESSEGSDAWDTGCSKRGWKNGKSNSAPILEKVSPSLQVSRQTRSQSDRQLAEIEATEACKWLRATGFPQYAQMYEDMQFPIDVSQAAQDHPFLENDVLLSLFRRLETLNSCAHLHQQRVAHTDESEDEFCALSENWTYQSDVRRWSRVCTRGSELEKASKRLESKDEVFENSTLSAQAPSEKLKRGGSTKYRRRRDGVCLSERDTPLDVLTSVGSLKTLEFNHLSDSELTPHHHVRMKNFEKQEIWTNHSSLVDRVAWQRVSQDEALNVEQENTGNSEEGTSLYNLTATQRQVLRKLALLKLTSHMEKYCPSHRTGWNWDLPKFIRKRKVPAYKNKNVFGVPLSLTLQKTGQALPKNIEEALRWLQVNATDQVGIFRKPGVKSRIQALRNLVESKVCVDYVDQQPYDVADMLKQYFRELPETLLTSKLSETFILIFQYVPPYLRREAVMCTLLLMPDEHLEVLLTLLHFLLSIAKYSEINQMNESNLAMCFAPSLFSYSQAYKQHTGSPHPKELAENKAGYDCLYYLLRNFNCVFKIPKDFFNQCKSNELKDIKPKSLCDLHSDNGGWKHYLKECQTNLLKEAKDRQRGWINLSCHYQKVELAYKKVADGIPLKLWKVSTEIDAPPFEVLHRLLRERHLWDPDLRSAKIVAQLESNSEIFQYVRGSTLPRPAEEYSIVRTWRTDLAKDACLLVETSVEHPDAISVPCSTRGLVLASRYLIEPCGSGRSRLLHLSRIDTMGRAPEWYQKHFGHLQALFVNNIMNSFCTHHHASGPESKV